MPTREQAKAAGEAVRAARERLRGRLVIDYVPADYHARFPKPCMGGWGSTGINVNPEGRVLPCHAAETIPGLVFETVRERPLAAIWETGRRSRVPRDRVDAGAVQELRAARDRLRRVPLSGDGAGRRCAGDGPGLRAVAAP